MVVILVLKTEKMTLFSVKKGKNIADFCVKI